MVIRMDEAGILEKLIVFGLTRQEAAIYLCLFKNGELTGYEVAKQTGISRSNVYGGLLGLTEKGAAYLLEGTANKYRAVPVEEFCANEIRNRMEDMDFLRKNMPSVQDVPEGYITIVGAKNIRNKITNMLRQARYRIYLSAPERYIAGMKEELEEAAERNIKLVLITDKETRINNAIQYLTGEKKNQIRLIIDSMYVLTGDIEGEKRDACLYTGHKNFVNVFKEALRNEIKLVELTNGEVKKQRGNEEDNE